MNQKKENSRASSGSKSSLKKVLNIFSIKYTALVFCAVFLFFGLAGVNKADAAIALLNHSVSGNSGDNVANGTATFSNYTLPFTSTSGNALVILVIHTQTADVSSITDTAGNIFSCTTAADNGGRVAQFCYALNITGSSNDVISITMSSGVNNASLHISEWSGVVTSSGLDNHAEGTGTGTAMDTGTLTTTNTNDVVIGGFIDSRGDSSIGAGFTKLSSDGFVGSLSEYQIVSSTGNWHPTATAGASTIWAAAGIALKTASSSSATSFTFTGPSSGNAGSASTNFTVTPVGGNYTGTITLTPTGSGSTGLSATVLTFSNSSTAQTFTITPTVSGTVTLTPTNNGSLTNPSNLTYTVNAVVPNAPTGAGATAGNAQATITFSAPAFNGGTAITGYTVTTLSNGGGASGTDSNAGSTSLSHVMTGLTN
ncbi:MAG: hypothetical protein P4L63_00825, partial [Candidatus Pacebacteria bacterium]|nr:hypothetical protein [Candidatus Paceibacterota bacterium]